MSQSSSSSSLGDGEKGDLEKPTKRLAAPWLLASGVTALILLALGISLGIHFGLRSHVSPQAPFVNITGGAAVGTYIAGPVVETNFADPCYIAVNGTHYAFATNRYTRPRPGQVNVQMATSSDFANWNLAVHDALPNAGSWAMGDYVWAPDVSQLDDGSFVMYYSARHAHHVRRHCVGAATSSTVQGPYTPLPNPIACPIAQGGAIDPDGFHDVDGKRYLLYKVDGNSLNNITQVPVAPPPLNATDTDNATSPDSLQRRRSMPLYPLHNVRRSNSMYSSHSLAARAAIPPPTADIAWAPTPIMLQEVGKDGITLIGEPTQILDRGLADGPLVEAPSVMRAVDSTSGKVTYVLFYSSNVFTSRHYDVAYAISTTGLRGPYTKAAAPLLKTGDKNGILFGPGGLDVAADGRKVVFHSGAHGSSISRSLYVGVVEVQGIEVII